MDPLALAIHLPNLATTAWQRLPPVATAGRTRVDSHQAAADRGAGWWHEVQLFQGTATVGLAEEREGRVPYRRLSYRIGAAQRWEAKSNLREINRGTCSRLEVPTIVPPQKPVERNVVDENQRIKCITSNEDYVARSVYRMSQRTSSFFRSPTEGSKLARSPSGTGMKMRFFMTIVEVSNDPPPD